MVTVRGQHPTKQNQRRRLRTAPSAPTAAFLGLGDRDAALQAAPACRAR